MKSWDNSLNVPLPVHSSPSKKVAFDNPIPSFGTTSLNKNHQLSSDFTIPSFDTTFQDKNHEIYNDLSAKSEDLPINFESRYESVMNNVTVDHPFIIGSPRLICIDPAYMKQYKKTICTEGGEGVMLRKPKSYYENGRSHSIIKYKKKKDGEAVVLEVKGIYCLCKLPNQKTFSAIMEKNLQNEQKNTYINSTVKVGDIVSFYCLGIKKSGLPYKPKIYRVRNDMIELMR